MQITKLTEEQKSQFEPWVQKWVEIGLRTGETDWETFEKYIEIIYKKANLVFPKKIIRVQSPPIGALASSIADKILHGGAVCGTVDGAVDGAVSGAVDGAVGSAVGKYRWHYWFSGQFWVGGWWSSPAYISFFVEICGLKLSQDIYERYESYRKICESVNYFWCNKDFIMVCARPKHIYRNQRGQLHSEDGKAIEYPDGWGLYMLNGVKVPEWLVMTPAERIDSALALKETNVDVQREIIRKIGAEKMLKATNAHLLDTWDETPIRQGDKKGVVYKLYEMKIGQNIRRKYLVYEHASMEGITYANAVPPETKKALHGRAFHIKLVNRNDLKNITTETEAEIIANLPVYVS